MEHDLETLEHQTAPESTRGLFDPPEQNPPPPMSTQSADKRRSFHVLGPVDNARSRQQQQAHNHNHHQRGHQRSKSAITSDMLPNQNGSRRNTNFGLHTLAEEEDGYQRRRQQQQQQQQQQDDQAITVDSLQDMINTLKTLPSSSTSAIAAAISNSSSSNINSNGSRDESNTPGSRRNSRKHQSLNNFGLPQGARRLSYNGSTSSSSNTSYRNSSNGGIDIQSVLPIPSAEEKADRRRSSAMRMRASSISEQDEDTSSFVSREAALAEAEAKLMGTYKKQPEMMNEIDASQSVPNSRRQSSRSSTTLSERPAGRRYSESSGSGNGGFDLNVTASTSASKRVSLQLPTLNENEPAGERANRRITFNKPLNLGNDTNKAMGHNRRSSRNFTDDWRNSAPSPGLPYSPRSSTYRNSFNLVPFTPTRVNFARDDANPHQRRPLFIAHLPFSALTPLFRARQLVRGMLRVNKRNRSDAYVSCEDLDADIYVCGSRDRNRALEGDVVAIRLVDVEKVLREKKEKEEAKLARNGGQVKMRQPDEEDENEIIFGGDDDVDTVKPKYCGVVVAILERAQNQVFSGTLTLMRPNNKRAQEEKAAEEAQKAETGQTPIREAPRIVWFKATDKRVPLIAIPIEQAPADFVDSSETYSNRLFVGSIKRWPITSLHPFGTLERELGAIEDLDIQTKAILADNNVTDTEFSEAVNGCLPAIPYQIEAETLEKRREMKDVRVFTLEAANAEVLDNAFSIQKLGDDTYEVGVHVSDVTHFIKAHSPLDKEARARAVRVELVHKSVPILPRELTEQITNLIPNEPRLTFSVVWKLSSAGKVLDTWFGKTIVKSCAKVSYEDAQKVIDNQVIASIAEDDIRTGVEQDIRMLYAITQQLNEARRHAGGMAQMRDELDFVFSEQREPLSIGIKAKDHTTIISEELLLLANQSVAQKISSQFPEQALLRRHAPPNERKIRELQEYATKHLGVPIDISSAKAIERTIESIQDPHLRKIMSIIVLKTLQPPKYFCTGTLDIMKYSHYALNVPLFTHFTSPSRRFTDLIVHRQLETALTGEKRFYLDRDTVQKLAQHTNVKKEAALYARDQSHMLFLAVYLSKRGVHKPDAVNGDLIVVRKEAIVVAVSDQYFDVMIPSVNLERRIHLANLPVWRANYDAQKRQLTMFWKKGMDTTTGKQRHWSLSDDEDDDLDEDALLEEMREGGSPPSTAVPSSASSSSEAAAAATTTSNGTTTTTTTTSTASTPTPNGSDATQQQQQQAINNNTQPVSITPSPSVSKRASMLHARLSDSTGYSTDQGTQTIQALDKIQVLVTVEMIKTPPLIRILGDNPYA
ncbi:hypothetical protein BDB00DRAFT_813360 [Zychaea mexicana]|uniref:uncharacterized protein n=1 Tax=Zychaea mexicana TaxID=64656 RepID=UPI0022FE1E6F|nr:uncharacterized protein BDB00DRAFT_813360 [Zychaea mexicana]KAI9495438.1 hypothetical protein BDB00DRAFT_813360 [Zychaea mexicana]